MSPRASPQMAPGASNQLPYSQPLASPAFAQSSSFQRPDHSSVLLASTTPLVSPPPSRSSTPRPEFAAKYGGYGSQVYKEDKDLLAAADVAFASPRTRRSPFAAVLTVVLPFSAFIALLYLLSHLSIITSPHQQISQHLTPFLPASFVDLIGPTSAGPAAPHPIIPLLTSANDQWANLLASQSHTFDKASRTYKLRYGRLPPRGFDRWFAFATQGRNHTLVDEYDQLMEDLLPFRSLSPNELKRRTAELAQLSGMSIVSIRGGVAQVHSKSSKYAPAVAFQQMLGAFVRDLPDMDVAINEKPEGRVLPRQQRKVVMEEYGLEEQDARTINMTDPMITPSLRGFKADWKRDGSVWEAFRRSCPTDSPSRRLVESVRSAESGVGAALQVQGRVTSKLGAPTTRRQSTGQAIPSARELTFNKDLDASFDICAVPSMHSLHSTFFSDQRSIEYLYPVFSPSKPAGYADILIPSHHYWTPGSEFTYEWELKRGLTKAPTDHEWSDKKSTIYWRGKVTRGADTPPGHASSFQKQRLVKMANEVSPSARRVLVDFDDQTAALTSISAPVTAVNKAVSDIAMACDPSLGECAYLRSLGYRVEPPAPLSEAWKHKYVLDLDEIGFSPRFLALMESKSAVVKSSVQREFWKGWVVPWKHYIPLSSAYAELYNIQTFFSGFPAALASEESLATTSLTRPYPVPELPQMADGRAFEGDRALQDIAEAGREWRQNHVRKADMECYVYRLMIEWAAMTATN